MLKTKIMPTIVLGSICLVVALLLSVVNMFTGPIIEKAQAEKANAALAVVLPGGTNFTELPVEGAGFPASVTAAYKADNGFVFQMTVTGYKPGLVIMCGIDNNGIKTVLSCIFNCILRGIYGIFSSLFVNFNARLRTNNL